MSSKHQKKPGESFDALMRRFRRKTKQDGVLQDVKDRTHFEKPSEKKKKEFRAAQRRTYLQQKREDD